MSATVMQQQRNSSSAAVEDVVRGLRRLLKLGGVAPQTILAVEELVSLPAALGSGDRGADAAILVSEALRRAIETAEDPTIPRLLFGTDPLAPSAPLGQRRGLAAEIAEVTPGSFRVRREPRLLEGLARALLVELATASPSVPRSKSAAHLEIERGAARGFAPLPPGRSPVLIGRSPECGIELSDDPLVSRSHAVLKYRDGQWTIEDLDSTNGTTTASGGLKSPMTLHDGDVVTIGRTRLTFRTDTFDRFATVRPDPE